MARASFPINSAAIPWAEVSQFCGAAFVTVPAKGGDAAGFVPNWIDCMTHLAKSAAGLAIVAALSSQFAPLAYSQQAPTQQSGYVYGAQGGYGPAPYDAPQTWQAPPQPRAQPLAQAQAACGGCQGVRVIYVTSGAPLAAPEPYAQMVQYAQLVGAAAFQTCGPPPPQEVHFTADTGGGVGGDAGGYYGGGGGGSVETGISGYGNISGWVGSHSSSSSGVNVNVNTNVSSSSQSWSNSGRGHGHGGNGGHGCGCVKPPPPPPPCHCGHH